MSNVSLADAPGMSNAVIADAPSSFASILQDNSQSLEKINSFRQSKITTTPRNLAFTGMVLFGVVMAIVFAAQIITGMFAIILTGATLIGGFLGLRFLKTMDPVIRQKTKNFLLKKMMEEAKDNAIYQLDNQVLENKKRLVQAREARNKMGALVQQLKSKIDPENEGKQMHERKSEMLAKVNSAYEKMCANLETSAKYNEEFKVKVNEYRDMNKFADLADEAMALLGTSGIKELEDMLSLEAFGAIDENFNSAIISIENSAKDMALDGGF